MHSAASYTEDEAYDMKERQAAIDAAYGCDCVGTGNMHLFPRAEEDENELVVFDRTRRPILTKFFRQFREAALDFRARLAVLDSPSTSSAAMKSRARRSAHSSVRLTAWREKSTGEWW